MYLFYLTCSDLSICPINYSEIFGLVGISVSRIIKSSLGPIFLLKVLMNCSGDSHEVSKVNRIIDVRVEIVLEMLEHVHVFLGKFVSPYSWESESLVVEFPSVDEDLGIR